MLVLKQPKQQSYALTTHPETPLGTGHLTLQRGTHQNVYIIAGEKWAHLAIRIVFFAASPSSNVCSLISKSFPSSLRRAL